MEEADTEFIVDEFEGSEEDDDVITDNIVNPENIT